MVIAKKKLNKNGFTLIELMIVIAIIGILAAIAIPNFIAYRNKTFCTAVESDANNIASSVADYFAIPFHDSIATGDQAFIPGVNTYTVSGPDANEVISITVTDASGRCPAEYTTAQPVNAKGDGWLDGSTYQKVIDK